MAILKTLISFVMGTFGAWMLWRGRKKMDVKMMLWGGALIVLSYFVFSGGSEDKEATKALLNMAHPGDQAAESQPQTQAPSPAPVPSPTPQS